MEKDKLLPYSIIFLAVSCLISSLIIYTGLRNNINNMDMSLQHGLNSVANSNSQGTTVIESSKVSIVQIGENRIGILNKDTSNNGYQSKIKVFEYNPQTQKWSYVSTFDYNNDSTYEFNLK